LCCKFLLYNSKLLQFNCKLLLYNDTLLFIYFNGLLLYLSFQGFGLKLLIPVEDGCLLGEYTGSNEKTAFSNAYVASFGDVIIDATHYGNHFRYVK
jgi:hypothetical protein